MFNPSFPSAATCFSAKMGLMIPKMDSEGSSAVQCVLGFEHNPAVEIGIYMIIIVHKDNIR